MWWLVVLNVILWTIVACGGFSCSFKRTPAKQQIKPITTEVSISKPVPVSQIDIDGDGQISPQEQQQLPGSHNITPVVISFVSIIGLVLVINLVLARLGARRVSPPGSK